MSLTKFFWRELLSPGSLPIEPLGYQESQRLSKSPLGKLKENPLQSSSLNPQHTRKKFQNFPRMYIGGVRPQFKVEKNLINFARDV